MNYCVFCRAGKRAHVGKDLRCPTRQSHFKTAEGEHGKEAQAKAGKGS